MFNPRMRWFMLITANVLFCCMLGFHQNSSAAPGAGRQPFSNSVEQRGEMIRQLERLNAQLQAQNQLLRSGKLQVIASEKQQL